MKEILKNGNDLFTTSHFVISKKNLGQGGLVTDNLRAVT